MKSRIERCPKCGRKGIVVDESEGSCVVCQANSVVKNKTQPRRLSRWRRKMETLGLT